MGIYENISYFRVLGTMLCEIMIGNGVIRILFSRCLSGYILFLLFDVQLSKYRENKAKFFIVTELSIG